MPEPVRLGPEELKQRYGLSQRLIARIGALAGRQVALSPVVMESARPGTAAERLLLTPLLSGNLENLAADDLNSAYRDLGGTDTLVVASWEDWRVIAIEEELQAEEGWEKTGGELIRIAPGDTSLGALLPHLEDVSGLFSPEEIQRLKLKAVAGADIPERVSAIRQLALSPAPPREKVAVFLNLLSDREPRVRSEAATALQALGLSSDVATAIASMAEGNEQQRLLAARRLIPLIENGGELEAFVIVRSLLRSLDHEPNLEIRIAILAAFTVAAPKMGHLAGEKPDVLRLLVQQLREQPQKLRLPVERALTAMASHDEVLVIRQLWELVRNESETGTKILILCFLSQKDLPGDVRAPVIQEMALQLAKLSRNDENSIRLGNLLSAHGAVACQALLSAFDRVHPLQRTHLVELLDRIATASEPPVSPEVKSDVAHLFLRLLEGDELTVRLAVLEGDLCGDPDLSQAIRAKLIEEVFANLHDYHNPRARALVEATVSGMGIRAVQPLLGIILRATRREEQVVALPVLGKAFAHLKTCQEPVAEFAHAAIETCEHLAETAPVQAAAAAIEALGDICSCPLIPADTLRKVSRDLRAGLGTSRRGTTRRAFEALQALGKICGNSSTPLEERLSTTNLFLQLFRSDLPEVSSEVLEEDTERIFRLGREILAYTDMVPTLLQGFQDICLAPEIPSSIRDRIIDALTVKWRLVMDFKEIWGPANLSLLLATLREVALGKVTSEQNRLRICQALSVDYARPSVLAALGGICFAKQDDHALGALVPGILEKALAYWVEQDRIERTDAPGLLHAFAQLVSVHHLGDDAEAADRLRARVLVLLYDALRHKVKDVDRALRELSLNSGIPEPVRDEIQDRLRNVFALARGGLPE